MVGSHKAIITEQYPMMLLYDAEFTLTFALDLEWEWLFSDMMYNIRYLTWVLLLRLVWTRKKMNNCACWMLVGGFAPKNHLYTSRDQFSEGYSFTVDWISVTWRGL